MHLTYRKEEFENAQDIFNKIQMLGQTTNSSYSFVYKMDADK